jgi:hypothetical protein
MTRRLTKYDPVFLRLLKLAPFERRSRGWRFGTKVIADHVVARLLASGRAESDGCRVWLAGTPPAATAA